MAHDYIRDKRHIAYSRTVMLNRKTPVKLTLILFGLLFICSCQLSEDKVDDSKEKRHTEANIELQVGNEKSFKVLSTKCYFDQLSSQFNFKLFVNYITADSAVIIVTTSNKHTDEIIDSIIVTSGDIMLPPMYGDCDDVRSYCTGFNKNKDVVDNCPGDFIVADLNFDGLDDFAVAVDNGGNGGYIYAFYVQNKKGRFLNDKFLTEEMLRFPVSFDNESRSLMTSVHANVNQDRETVYQFSGGKWKQISSKLVP